MQICNDPVPQENGSRNEALCDHKEISLSVAQIFEENGKSFSKAVLTDDDYVLIPRTSETSVSRI